MGQPPPAEATGPFDPYGPAADPGARDAMLLAVCGALLGPDPSAAVAEALGTVGRGMGVDRVFLLGAFRGVGGVVQAAGWRRDGDASAADGFRDATAVTAPTLHAAVHEGQALRIDDVAQLPDGPNRAFWTGRGVSAVLAAPIASPAGRPGGGGMLGIERHAAPGRPWTPQQEQSLRLVAGPLALALSRHRLLERLDFHLDNAPISVIEWDAAFRVRRWSRGAEELFGWAAGDVLGRPLDRLPLVHPDDAENVRELATRLTDGTMRHSISENRNLRRDGREVTCAWINSAQRDAAGRVVSVLSFAHDLTDRDAAARALAAREEQLVRLNAGLEAAVAERTRDLAESERRHRRLTEYATDMISAHDPEGRFTYVSHACRTLLGHAPDDLVGTRPRELAHPEDRGDMLRAHQRMRDTGGEVRYTWRGRHRDGRYVWLESASRNLGPEPVVVTREVGGRLGAELRLRLVQSAVEQVNEGVVITDAQITAPGPKILYVNPAFTRMTGYTEDELVGRTPRLLQGPETDAAVMTRTRGALRRGEATEGEAVNYRRDGSTYLAHWTIHPLRDAAGNLTHWVSVQRDASERRADEDLERRHRDELAHVTRLSMMGEMASGLAHEINQPLTSITTYVEGLRTRLGRDDLGKDVLADILGRVADQAGVASQIIRRLRAFVLKRGTVRSDQPVNDLVRETLALLGGDLKRRRIEVRFEAGEALPPVSVDGVQIQQVLVNLIRNAVEATEAATPLVGGPPRPVELVTAADGPRGIRIDVIDRGVGLTRQRLDRVFDPFFSTKDDGMGMGLTISRSIAEAHGGRLWAVANPRRGCTFSLVLPAVSAHGFR